MKKTTHGPARPAFRTRTTLLMTAALAAAGCSDPTGLAPCMSPSAVEAAGGSCLVYDDAGALDAHRAIIEAEVERTLQEVREVIPVDGVEIRIRADPDGAIPEIGIGGRAHQGDVVSLAFDPSSARLESSLATALFPLLAHELHHIARQRTVGYGTSLLGAMVSEGLADHFSVEMAGGAPPIWATALSPAELDRMLEESRAHWHDDDYDHGAWFFGDGAGIPRWTGYSVGWMLVERYLADHPGQEPSDLHDEPAASFAVE